MRYEIIGGSFPAVVCHLSDNEQMKTERGSMIWMSANMEMSTQSNGIGKGIGRMFSGDSFFQNTYASHGDGMIAFGSSFPGRIIALDVSPQTEFVVQKSAFLASEMGVELSVFFNKKIGGGLFGGEGFIMQRLSGYGTAFIECDGDIVKYVLEPNQEIIVDTGNVLGFSSSVKLDIQRIHGVKNMVFGGEGVFNTRLTGPGEIWLQTMPIYNLVAALESVMTPDKNAGSTR